MNGPSFESAPASTGRFGFPENCDASMQLVGAFSMGY